MILGPVLLTAVAADAPSAPASEASERAQSQAALDPGIRKIIEAAVASGDDATLVKVLALARKVAPEARAEIDRYDNARKSRLAAHKAREQEARNERLRARQVLANWRGELELGAFRTTGTSSNFGVLGSLDVQREGLRWTHALLARAEFQSTNGKASMERNFARWQPKYRFGERTYVFGLAQYEHDLFAGYDDRYTLGGGIGYRAVTEDALLLEVEGGPAFRRVEGFDDPGQSRVVGWGSLNLNWKVTPTLTLKQKAWAILEHGNNNAVAQTALDTKLIGSLKARLSYNVQYEERPVRGAESLNTQTRASFVYGF